MKKIAIIYLFVTMSSFAGFTDTQDYWKCTNKSGGSWNFGRAPNVCDVHHFVDPEYVKNEFAKVIFDDSSNVDAEREEYMTYMYGVIRDTARYYILSRKPEAEEDEIEAFVKSSYAIAHQESYWSHYRKPSNGRMQFMRGDYGHGHGMMQVDDRWHFTAINQGKGANLILNIVYSLEEYYDAWERAPSQKCVNSPTDWYAISRSAYSAYNGGASRICRWTNPRDKWARNDKGFKAKYDNRQWENYITDFEVPSFVDIGCIISGGTNCENDGSDNSLPRVNVIYRSNENGNCVYDDSADQFLCTQERFAQCLHHKIYDGSTRNVSYGNFKDEWDTYPVEQAEVEGICSTVEGLIKPGSRISLKKNINVRRTPGGDKLGVISSGKTAQVLSYEVTEAKSLKRYYQISFGSKVGYVYAGDKSDYSSWASISNSNLSYQKIAEVGNYVSSFENLPSMDDSSVNLINGEAYEVLGVTYNVDLSLNYELDVDGSSYHFYAGSLNPYTHDDFFKITKKVDTPNPTPEPPKPVVKTGRLSKSIWWKKIYSCPSTSCKKAGTLRGPRLTKKKLKIYENKNGWLKVEQSGKVGWIKQQYVKVY